MKCMNVMQYKSQRQKRETQKKQESNNNGHIGKAMKHKDHIKNTQLV